MAQLPTNEEQDRLNNDLMVAACSFDLVEVKRLVKMGAQDENAFLSDQGMTFDAETPDYNAELIAILKDQGHKVENENQALFELYETLLLAGHPVPDGSNRMCLTRVIAGCNASRVARAGRLLELCMDQGMFDWNTSVWARQIGTAPIGAPLRNPLSQLLEAANEAGEHGNLPLLKQLVERSGPTDPDALKARLVPNASSFSRALPVRTAAGGDIACMDYVLDLMPEEDWASSWTSQQSNALQTAAGHGHAQLVRHLVARGADINGNGKNKSSPLVAALQNKKPSMVPVLLELGADPNGGHSLEGAGPINLALWHGYREAFDQLLAAGADAVRPDKNGMPLIVMAGMIGNDWALEPLAKAGADVGDYDTQGRTALSWAAMNNRTACIEWLLEAGADLEQVDNEGRTPLSWATERDMVDAYERLGAAGANPHAPDNSGDTPEGRALAKGGQIAAALQQRQHEATTAVPAGPGRRVQRI